MDANSAQVIIINKNNSMLTEPTCLRPWADFSTGSDSFRVTIFDRDAFSGSISQKEKPRLKRDNISPPMLPLCHPGKTLACTGAWNPQTKEEQAIQSCIFCTPRRGTLVHPMPEAWEETSVSSTTPFASSWPNPVPLAKLCWLMVEEVYPYWRWEHHPRWLPRLWAPTPLPCLQ